MRMLWFAAGTAAGVYATAKARRAAEAVTLDGIHDRLTGWFAGARVLGEELRTGTAEKETELRRRLQLVPDGKAALPAGTRHDQHHTPSTDTTDSTHEDTGKGDH